MAGPSISGIRGTGTFSETFRPKNYRELYTLLEPNGSAPLNALLAMGQSEPTSDPEYRNFQDDLPARVMTTSAAVADTTTGSITLAAGDDNRYAVNGAILVNATTGEVMRVTADTTGTALAVTRNIGSTTFQIASGAKLFLAGFAAAEGGSAPSPVSFDVTMAFNYTQIFRTSFQLTNTLRATTLRTGPKEDELRTKALKLHMTDIERAMFFGRRVELNGSTAQPTRITGGLINSLSNVTDISTEFASFGGASAGQMNEQGFDFCLIDRIFAFGSKQKIAFVGSQTANIIQQMGKRRWNPVTLTDTYGVSMTKYTTYAGDLMVYLHPQFRQIPLMTNAMIIVDFPYLRYRYLEGRDTTLLENRQAPDIDGVIHEYRTECGLELLQDKVHAVIKGWTTLATG